MRMRSHFIAGLTAVLLLAVADRAQPQQPATIEQRVLVLLETGSTTPPPGTDMRALQRGHLANIRAMAEDGILYVAGPLASPENDHRVRGILMFGPPSQQLLTRIEGHLANDPMIKAGYLVPKIRTLMFEKGASLDAPVGTSG